jgi:hypothetical protein
MWEFLSLTSKLFCCNLRKMTHCNGKCYDMAEIITLTDLLILCKWPTCKGHPTEIVNHFTSVLTMYVVNLGH